MEIKTVVTGYAPKAEEMAKQVEEIAEKMELDGYELVTFSITGSAKGILVFRKRN